MCISVVFSYFGMIGVVMVFCGFVVVVEIYVVGHCFVSVVVSCGDCLLYQYQLHELHTLYYTTTSMLYDIYEYDTHADEKM